MVSVPSTHLVIFIASIAVAAGVAGAFTTEASRLSGTLDEVGIDVSDEVDTDIEIVTDAGATVYDPVSDNVSIHVQNLGETTLPHDAEQVDVFLDGEYQPAANLTIVVEGASSWAPDVAVRIDIADADLADGDHRVKVAVDGDEDVIEFTANGGCGAAVRNVLVFEDPSTNDLAFVDRSGAVTDLGEPTGGDELRAFGPAADFDCDGLVEAPYVVGGESGGPPGDRNPTWEALMIVDENGETQTLEQWGGNSGEVGEGYTSRLGAGDLDGDGTPEVVYPDPADSEDLHRVEVGEEPSQIGPGYDAEGVGGLGDFNGDGDLDLVYVAVSGDEVLYLENQNEFGTNEDADNGNNIGSPGDFDGDGVDRVPIKRESGSEYLVLVDNNGNTEVLDSGSTGLVGSIATFDWNNDGVLDVVWSDGDDNNYLYVTEMDGTTTRLEDEDGDPIATTDRGVA